MNNKGFFQAYLAKYYYNYTFDNETINDCLKLRYNAQKMLEYIKHKYSIKIDKQKNEGKASWEKSHRFFFAIIRILCAQSFQTLILKVNVNISISINDA